MPIDDDRPDEAAQSLTVPRGSKATLAVLVRELTACSHAEAKKLVVSGRVLVDGTPELDAVARPRAGSVVTIAAHGIPKSKRPIEGPGFRIVHLEDTFVVVDKDAGIVTVPTTKDEPNDPPLVTRVIAAMGVAGHRVRDGLYVVHRIDRGTSGLVLFARTEMASRALRAQFRARKPLREYIAWTEGIPEPAEGTLHHLLRENERSRRVFAVRHGDDAKDAELDYVVEATTVKPDPRARVRVRLVTGRRNQVRVQFSAEGWPLLGDPFYGANDEGPGRVALHAARLGFAHPVTAAPLEFEAPWPHDLVKLDRRLFGYKPPSRKKKA